MRNIAMENGQVRTVHYERHVNPGMIGVDPQLLARRMAATYLWMVFGLLISGLTAVGIYLTPEVQATIFGSKIILYSIIAAQFIALISFQVISQNCRTSTAIILYLIYSVLMGITLSIIFLVYNLTSIVAVLFTTSFAFLVLSSYGFVTKRDLNALGTFCLTGLFGMVGLILVFFLFPSLYSETMSLTWSAIGVIVFSGLIAYDTQKIKSMLIKSEYTLGHPGVINAALFLYLDFINLFLNLLRIFGGRK